MNELSMEEYQRRAIFFAKPIELTTEAIAVYALGIGEEAKECFDLLLPWKREGRLSTERLFEELGDCLWYISTLSYRLEIQLEDLFIELDSEVIPSVEEAIVLFCATPGTLYGLTKKWIGQGHTLKQSDVFNALVEVLKNMAAIVFSFGLTFEELAWLNIAKLEKIYENGFSEQVSRDRAIRVQN